MVNNLNSLVNYFLHYKFKTLIDINLTRISCILAQINEQHKKRLPFQTTYNQLTKLNLFNLYHLKI